MNDAYESAGKVTGGLAGKPLGPYEHLGRVSFWHPSRLLFRLVIFFLASFMVFGSYLNYDTVGAVASDLKDDWGFSSSYIGALYSVYSLPNVVLPMFGGALVDALGSNKSALLFSLLCLVGSAVVAATPFFSVMMVGRFVFGLGAESLVVTQSSILSRWFLGKELALSFGAALTVSRLGSVLAFWSMPSISSHVGLQWAFVFASGTILFSFCCTMVLAVMQTIGERLLKWYPVKSEFPPRSVHVFDEVAPLTGDPNGMSCPTQDAHGGSDISSQSEGTDETQSVSGNSIVDRLEGRDALSPAFVGTPTSSDGSHHLDEQRSKGKRCILGIWASSRSLVWFPLTFWLVTFACVVFYGSVFPFIAFSADYLKEEHDFSKTSAGLVASVITFTSMVFSPVFGWMVDCIGHRVSLLIVGMALMVPSFTMLALSPYTPIPWIVVIGMGFSLVPATLWPCVPLLVDADRVGTAFGVMTVCQNVGLLIVPYVVGGLKDWTDTYMAGNLLFACMCAVGLIGSVWLFIHDRRNGSVLQRRA